MRVLRTCGVLAVTLGAVAPGCSIPEQRTDLRSEGPPEVLSVLVMNDAEYQLVETATYCKDGDPEAPTLVGLPDFTTQEVCPSPGMVGGGEVPGAVPGLWYVRVMFDELLDPEVETLEPIFDDDGMETGQYYGSLYWTQPVTLLCNGNVVDYDGYYAPNGNNVTWPLGPSLYVAPTGYVATGSFCTLTLGPDIHDKSGEAVPEDQRGPFEFAIAPLELVGSDPEPATTAPEVSPDGAVTLIFNAPMDLSSLSTSELVLTQGGSVVPGGQIELSDAAGANTISVAKVGGFNPSTSYNLTIDNASVLDVAGGGADISIDLDFVTGTP